MRNRNHASNDSRHHNDWLEFAACDIRAAQLLMQEEDCYPLAAFHCQQCMEKVLKAYILFKTGQLVDGHNLIWLLKQASKRNASFKQWIDECVYINHFYIEARYPSDFELEINKDRMNAIYTKAKALYDDVSINIYEEDILI